MKKRWKILSLVLWAILLLSACHLQHEWMSATCEEPQTCSHCGKIKGDALGHNWKDASCEEPKTCARCGKTEGDALGHDWEDATCEEPKTCSRCGKTEGDALGHDWEDISCEEPKTCSRCGATEGDVLGHDWEDATCEEPKTCSRCGKTEGDALGHDWEDATCEEPKTCSQCGATEGDALGHDYSAETVQKAATCIRCGDMKPSDLPANGTVFLGSYLGRGSRLTIRSSTSQSCYIKMKNSSGEDVFSFFVQAGQTAEVAVPCGEFYVYFAYGDDWYGTDYAFGKDTSYSKDDELLDFSRYMYEYTLYPVTNGNFSDTPIDAEDF